MGAFSTKNMTVWMEKKPGSSPAPVSITSVTNSKPAVATVSVADISKFKDGDLVSVAGTNMTSIDGKFFIVDDVDDLAHTFALNGSDASGEVASATTGTITNHMADMLEICLSSIEYTQEPAQAISVGTTCDPSAQIAGEPQAGGLSLAGFVDYLSAGYKELLKAVEDNIPRTVMVKLPPTAVASGVDGRIIYPNATASGYSETASVGAAVAYTAQMTLGTKPVRVVE